jgi:hypothetical protein
MLRILCVCGGPQAQLATAKMLEPICHLRTKSIFAQKWLDLVASGRKRDRVDWQT